MAGWTSAGMATSSCKRNGTAGPVTSMIAKSGILATEKEGRMEAADGNVTPWPARSATDSGCDRTGPSGGAGVGERLATGRGCGYRGGAARAVCFLGPTNHVASKAAGQQKSANNPHPSRERPRLRARTRQRRTVPKTKNTIALEDICKRIPLYEF